MRGHHGLDGKRLLMMFAEAVFFFFPEANRDLDSEYPPICFAVRYKCVGATNWLRKAKLPPLRRQPNRCSAVCPLLSSRERPHGAGRTGVPLSLCRALYRKAEQL